MADQSEYRAIMLPVEFRANDDSLPTVEGSAMVYGRVSEVLPGLRERFHPGAFGDLSGADVVLNVQHDRSRPLARTGGSGLRLNDTTGALEVRAELDPRTRDGADAAALLERRILRGFSVEFIPEDSQFEGGIREVRKARLVGLGLVDSPAHRGSLAHLRQLARECEYSDPELVGRAFRAWSRVYL